ncbi:MAG: hypothetical protein VKK59_00465 [Vampirovibrionales bacterium]|nr:hypothetical protein [Vampirovibrionales bacterium]
MFLKSTLFNRHRAFVISLLSVAIGVGSMASTLGHGFGMMPAWAASTSPVQVQSKASPTVSPQKPSAAIRKAPCLVSEGSAAVACSAYAEVTSLDLVQRPADYLNKLVKFEAEFNTFSTLGLDYSRAKRDARDYYGLMVRRPDVSHHVIPLSELKLFAKRPDEPKNEQKQPPKTVTPQSQKPQESSKEADTLLKNWMELERGDRILIYGKVFSAALDDPWMDVQRIDLLKKAPSKKKKSPDV